MQATRKKSQEETNLKPTDLSNLSLEESKTTVQDQDKTPTTPTTPKKSSQNETDKESSSSRLALEWTGFVGYDDVKQILLEYILFPVKYPQLFTGHSRKMSIFLYGPPGVGKTKFVKAAADEFNINLFTIQASDLMSKYLGDPERVLKETFQAAKEKQPSIIFIDDIDYLFSSRQEHGGESLRRVKTEFLIQYEQIPKGENVFVIGAGNCPWDLDLAVRKRFDKKVYIKLPDLNTRELLFKELLFKEQFSTAPNDLSSAENLNYMANQTEGYSCADIVCLARDTIFEPVREFTKATHFRPVETLSSGEVVYEPCQPNDEGAKEISFMTLTEKQMKMRPLEIEDFKNCLIRVKRSVDQEYVARYEEFRNLFE